ncbi:oligosaccharyltransferase delta subunit [Schizosaccharomyces japonicus yFS275]|uniref:Oligosaccharyltransferase delta subunit n=1 Tax=Schizosaccharomyces japonicus (strain yFS275 / FY16936) TaxID=402676 RepID=B6K5W4_SCHJY|nr:oligosaccharyltransferase delta subunit [Schizosaccharomyces japonicus yFS275]EEB08918.2 oligosaccharyltransferase delta subunit [Schizosaccharomyces japonicus yFS275]
MKLFSIACLFTAVSSALCSSWGLLDASLRVRSPSTNVGGSLKLRNDQFSEETEVPVSPLSSLSLSIKAGVDGIAARPHQAHLAITVKDQPSLELVAAIPTKEDGSGSLKLPLNEIPLKFLSKQSDLALNILLGSFGDAEAVKIPVGVIPSQSLEAFAATEKDEKNAEFKEQPIIVHQFAPPPKDANEALSYLTMGTVVAGLVLLVSGWLCLNVNIDGLGHMPMGKTVCRLLFFAWIMAVEGLLAKYWVSLTFFQLASYVPGFALVGLLLSRGI